VLKAMRRSYRRDRYLGIIDKVRAAMPDAAITTDIIVGFPGETDADFEQTLEVVRESRFTSAYTFQYSKRPGTPAAEMADQVPADVVRERYQRLTVLVEELAWSENRGFVGRDVEVLVAVGEGRKDEQTHRLSGRARDNRLVHFAVPDHADVPRPGDLVTVGVTHAAPHHLVADSGRTGGTFRLRRTRAGDAFERATAGESQQRAGVLLGMPGVGAPAPLPVVESACGIG
jgi:tRNA-2-methylthio-N6-dimethylallyladenosine synthase